MTKGFAIAVLVAAGAVGTMVTAAQTPQAAPAQAPQQPPPAGGRQGGPPPGRGGGGMLAGAGPSDKPVVDAASADRGRKVWASECIDCHGTQARGGDKGPNLVRSVLVLRDRYGSQLGPVLNKGHKLQSGTPSADLTDAQVTDLAHFLRQRVNDGLRGSPLFQIQDILTGDPKAGEAFFNGEGKCATCHSTTGNLAGIGARLEPVDIQQRFLFPQTGRGGRGGRGGPAAPNPNVVRVTVTPEGAAAVTGVLVQMDDFYVTLRNAEGTMQTFKRTAGMKVEKTDPFAYHVELLDKLTDKNIHDVVAYLEKLK
jgi:mono/diheme cytochrome c family protein